MTRQKRFREIRIYENFKNPRTKYPDSCRPLFKDLNQVSFLFGEKLREFDFRVDRFPSIYLLFDPNISVDQKSLTEPYELFSDVLLVISGVPAKLIETNASTGWFADLIAKQLLDVIPSLGGNSNLVEQVRSLVAEEGLELRVVLLEKETVRYKVRMLFKCIQRHIDSEEMYFYVPIDSQKNYAPGVAVYLESFDKQLDFKQTRLLFETTTPFVDVFNDAVIEGDCFKLVPKASAQAKAWLRTFSEDTVVPIFINQEKQPGTDIGSRLLQS